MHISEDPGFNVADKLGKCIWRITRCQLKPGRYNRNKNPLEREGSRYRTLVIARHEKQRNRYLDDLALQVSNAVMGASDPGESLTKFICKIEARVFADMQSAPPQELNENYGLPTGGRPDM